VSVWLTTGYGFEIVSWLSPEMKSLAYLDGFAEGPWCVIGKHPKAPLYQAVMLVIKIRELHKAEILC